MAKCWIWFPFLMLVQIDASACACISPGHFTKVARKSEFVFYGEVTSVIHYENRFGKNAYAEVKILEIWKGGYPSRTVNIYGSNNEDDCTMSVTDEGFPVGKKIVAANYSSPMDGGMSISWCGEHIVSVSGSMAKGRKYKRGKAYDYKLSLPVLRKIILGKGFKN